MKKKPPVLRFPKPKASRFWHNGSDNEVYSYALSLKEAARTLVELVDSRHPRTHWADDPIILLYRQSLELHLKSLVSAGSNCLKKSVDPIFLFETHSLRWLAQIACQIIRAMTLEKHFKCDGVATLADFSALINEVESLDPVVKAIQLARVKGPNSVSDAFLTFDVVRFANKLESLLDLLDATSDALAATWDLQAEGISAELDPDAGEDFKPTIH